MKITETRIIELNKQEIETAITNFLVKQKSLKVKAGDKLFYQYQVFGEYISDISCTVTVSPSGETEA